MYWIYWLHLLLWRKYRFCIHYMKNAKILYSLLWRIFKHCRAIRAVNNISFKAHSDPIFFRLELQNFDDTYKHGVLSFMHKYFFENLPASFHDMFNSLAEPNRTKSFKLERVLFKTLECFPSALFPKLWNSIELEL